MQNKYENMLDDYITPFKIGEVYADDIQDIYGLYRQYISTSKSKDELIENISHFKFMAIDAYSASKKIKETDIERLLYILNVDCNSILPEETDKFAPIILPWILFQSKECAKEFNCPEYYVAWQLFKIQLEQNGLITIVEN